ncbi:fumarate hydratase [Ferrovibrio terrae]|uniref:fumarate hydratase n=1 Tax=Ferrovibrio terrae TaxID=2594003 RepID=UPI003137DEDE
MAITYEIVKAVAADLYGGSLKKIPEDTKAALHQARSSESDDSARATIDTMLRSAKAAEQTMQFVCSDSGVPEYLVRIGTEAQLSGNIKQAFVDGFAYLVETIEPPLLMHVQNPLTRERGYAGKDMPLVTYDLIDGADYIEIICSPKALGSGRWAAMEIFTSPPLDVIEKYILECVLKAGSQACPPVVIGVGIGGSFDYCAKLAKQATLRELGKRNPEPAVAAMEERLLKAVNKTGFGPMGTGGDSTAFAVHVEYAAGHGFTPVAVSFNCWINRKAGARIYNDGRVERFE